MPEILKPANQNSPENIQFDGPWGEEFQKIFQNLILIKIILLQVRTNLVATHLLKIVNQ